MSETYDSEKITVADTAIGFTAAKLTPSSSGPPTIARVYLETAQIRFTVHGTDPTSTTGKILEVGQEIEIDSFHDISKFKAIRTGSTSGVITVHFERG